MPCHPPGGPAQHRTTRTESYDSRKLLLRRNRGDFCEPSRREYILPGSIIGALVPNALLRPRRRRTMSRGGHWTSSRTRSATVQKPETFHQRNRNETFKKGTVTNPPRQAQQDTRHLGNDCASWPRNAGGSGIGAWDADHGFNFREMNGYDASIAADAWRRTLAFLDSHLK